MADIAHYLPASVQALESTAWMNQFPGLHESNFATGPSTSRVWSAASRRSYNLVPTTLDSTALEEFETFLHNRAGGFVYIMEPTSGTHYDLYCGGLADGTKTTFPIPVYNPSDVTIFVDGVPQSTGYTVHSTVNLHPYDTGALPSSTDNYGVEGTGNSLTIDSAIGVAGQTSAKIDTAGVATALALAKTAAGHQPPVTGGGTYTQVALLMAGADIAPYYWKLRTRWYDTAYLSAGGSGNLDTPLGVWTAHSVTLTADASATYAATCVFASSASAVGTVYLGGFALCPGDYDTWHLPSQAPGCVEFATAPASGARITATATGKRITRCYVEVDPQWSWSNTQRVSIPSIKAKEVLEY